MASIGATAFEIRSTLELASDEYEATAASSDTFRNANDADKIKLEAGLIDPATMTPKRVGHLEGEVDSYEIQVAGNSLLCKVQGRDHMAEILERKYEKLYLLAQPEQGQEPTIPYAVGNFLASEIAADVVASTGLKLSWECRDYTLLEYFSAVGRPMDILKALVDPWSQVPMSKVDLLVQSDVVICRPRTGIFVADYPFTIPDARIKNLTIRKGRKHTYVGKLTLHGKLVPKGMTGGGAVVIQSGEVEETSVSETKDQSGRVIGRVSKTTTYRMPDRIVIRVHEQTYDLQQGVLKLTKQSDQENEWEASRYDPSGPMNQPKQLGQATLNSGIHLNDKQKRFRELSKEEVRFSYDEQGFQDLTNTRKWSLNLKTSALDENERIYRTLKDVTQLETEEVTTVYKRAKSGEFYVHQTNTVKSAGLRPGGRKPPRTITIGQGNEGPMEPLTLEVTLSTNKWAKDYRVENRNLEQDDLEFIKGQFAAYSGKWEYTLNFQCVTMPWIKKGKVIYFTGLMDHLSNPLPLQPALITDNTLSYDESSEMPEMTSRITAVFWSDT